MRDPFVPCKLRGKASARAMPEWIAGGEHGGRTSPARQHAGCIERHGPGPAPAVDAGEPEMTLAAEHGLGALKRVSACFRQPGKAIFADADDGQPGFSHDARPS